MDLARKLDAFYEGMMLRADPATAELIERVTRNQIETKAGAEALRVGDVAPEFELPDQHGRRISLGALLERGPLLLHFFRGGWCPFCTITLRAMQEIESKLARHGVRLAAISPQTEAQGHATSETSGLCFPLLSDHDNGVARRFGVVWQLDRASRDLYLRLGHDLTRINGVESWELPLPASYLIEPDRRIAYARVEVPITKRMEPDEALAVSRALAEAQGARGPMG